MQERRRGDKADFEVQGLSIVYKSSATAVIVPRNDPLALQNVIMSLKLKKVNLSLSLSLSRKLHLPLFRSF